MYAMLGVHVVAVVGSKLAGSSPLDCLLVDKTRTVVTLDRGSSRYHRHRKRFW